jgi:hypothetical protein
MKRNLSKAVRITAVSESSDTNGYIEFETNDGNTARYDIAGNNYVEYGVVGNLSDLAGPVSLLTFACYDVCDLDSPLSPVSDTNVIRVIKVNAVFTNSASLGQDETFTRTVYLRVNANTGSGLLACWKLDETSGLTAEDSSGNGNDGALRNMAGDEWIDGVVGGALHFDGSNDYVAIQNLYYDSSGYKEVSVTAWIRTSNGGNQIIASYDRNEYWRLEINGNGGGTGQVGWDVRTSTGQVDYGSITRVDDGEWHHVAGVFDNGTLIVYIDGVAEPSASGGSTFGRGVNTRYGFLGVGSEATTFDGNKGPFSYFNGDMDDVRIYSRALDAGEIAALANVLRYRDFNEAKAASNTTSIAVSRPPDTSAGDLLIAAVATDGSTSTTIAPVGGGWTLCDRGSDSGNNTTLGVWWKIAGAAEPADYTFAWSGNEQAYGWIMRFTGHDASNPINVSQSAYSSGTPNPISPAVTTTVSNCMILRLGAFDDDDVNTLPEPGNPGLSGHTAITMDESASSSTSAVEILGSWVSGTAHATESGVNRALVFFAHAEDNDNPPIAIVDPIYYGGQAMTKVIEQAQNGSTRAYVVAYILDEAGIAAAGSDTFSSFWNQAPDRAEYYSVFLCNVNQSALVGASAGSGVSNTNIITTAALTTNSGDMVLEAATSSSTGTYTAFNGFTMDNDFSVSQFDGMNGHKSATGAAETPFVRHSDGSNVRHVLIGFVVQGGVTITGTVSGGAGYIRQATAGSSGAPTFTLTASQEARMLTIGIAPADNEYLDCCPELRP